MSHGRVIARQALSAAAASPLQQRRAPRAAQQRELGVGKVSSGDDLRQRRVSASRRRGSWQAAPAVAPRTDKNSWPTAPVVPTTHTCGPSLVSLAATARRARRPAAGEAGAASRSPAPRAASRCRSPELDATAPQERNTAVSIAAGARCQVRHRLITFLDHPPALGERSPAPQAEIQAGREARGSGGVGRQQRVAVRRHLGGRSRVQAQRGEHVALKSRRVAQPPPRQAQRGVRRRRGQPRRRGGLGAEELAFATQEATEASDALGQTKRGSP